MPIAKKKSVKKTVKTEKVPGITAAEARELVREADAVEMAAELKMLTKLRKELTQHLRAEARAGQTTVSFTLPKLRIFSKASADTCPEVQAWLCELRAAGFGVQSQHDRPDRLVLQISWDDEASSPEQTPAPAEPAPVPESAPAEPAPEPTPAAG